MHSTTCMTKNVEIKCKWRNKSCKIEEKEKVKAAYIKSKKNNLFKVMFEIICKLLPENIICPIFLKGHPHTNRYKFIIYCNNNYYVKILYFVKLQFTINFFDASFVSKYMSLRFCILNVIT